MVLFMFAENIDNGNLLESAVGFNKYLNPCLNKNKQNNDCLFGLRLNVPVNNFSVML